MASWKKVIVSGSQAELAAVSASIALQVGSNQQITTSQSTTFLTGSFTGSFKGDGTGLILPITNDGNDRVITANGNGTLTAETSLTYNGTLLSATSIKATSGLTVSGSTILSQSVQLEDTLDVDGQSTLASVNVQDLVSNEIVLAGTNGELTGSSNLTFDGTEFSVGSFDIQQASGNVRTDGTLVVSGSSTINGAVQLKSTLDVDGQATVASLNVEDLATPGRVVIVGSSGEISDDSGLMYDPSTDALSISGSLAVLNGTITTTATTANIVNTTATTVNFAGDATSLNMGNASGLTTVAGDLTVAGDFVVQGDVTSVNTTNLFVEDKFILLNSGSTSDSDGGIIVQNNISGVGYALGYDSGTSRWALDANLSGSATDLVPDSYLTTTEYGLASAIPANPSYGGATGYGNIWVSTDTGEIFIYS